MSLQTEILSDVIHHERMGDLSPATRKNRAARAALAAVRCCLQASWSRRILDALDGPATGCCVAG